MDADRQLTYLFRRQLGKVGVDPEREWFEEQLPSVRTVKGSELLLDSWATPPTFFVGGDLIDEPQHYFVDSAGQFSSQGSIKLLYREPLASSPTYTNVFTSPSLRFSQPQYGVVLEAGGERVDYDRFQLLDDVVVAPALSSGNYLITVYIYSGRVGTDCIPQLRTIEPLEAACLVLKRDGSGTYLEQRPINGSGAIAVSSDDVAEGSENLYFTEERCRAAISDVNSDAIVEGDTNKFYSQAVEKRLIDEIVDCRTSCNEAISTLTVDNIAETDDRCYLSAETLRRYLRRMDTSMLDESESALYFTDERVIRALRGASTDNIQEGTQLFYTSERVRAVFESLTLDDLADGSGRRLTDQTQIGRMSSRLSVLEDDLKDLDASTLSDVHGRFVDAKALEALRESVDSLSDVHSRFADVQALDALRESIASLSVHDLKDLDTMRVESTDDLREGRQLFFTDARARAALQGMTLDSIADGSSRRLHTEESIRTIASEIQAALTTESVHEAASHLYFTPERARDVVSEMLRNTTSDSVSEGEKHKYFSDELARDAARGLLSRLTLDDVPDGSGRSLVDKKYIADTFSPYATSVSALESSVTELSNLVGTTVPRDEVTRMLHELRDAVRAEMQSRAAEERSANSARLSGFVRADALHDYALKNSLSAYARVDSLDGLVRADALDGILSAFATLDALHAYEESLKQCVDTSTLVETLRGFVDLQTLRGHVREATAELATKQSLQAHADSLRNVVRSDELVGYATSDSLERCTAALAETRAGMVTQEEIRRYVLHAELTLDNVVDGTNRKLVSDEALRSRLEALDSDSISEGTRNRYWSDERLRAALHTGNIIESDGMRFWTDERVDSLVASLTLDSIQDGVGRRLLTSADVPSSLDAISDGSKRRLLTMTDVQTALQNITTSDVKEAQSLFFTPQRVLDVVGPLLNELTTDDIAEGTQRYFSGEHVTEMIRSEVAPKVSALSDRCDRIDREVHGKAEYTEARFRDSLTRVSTADILEHPSHLYFNETSLRRLLSRFSTDDLAEGSKSYFSISSFSDHDVTTSHVREGSHLYFTEERVLRAVSNAGYVTAAELPTADEVASLVNVPTVDDVAAAVLVPTAQDIASLVRVPTIDEILASVRVPTAADVAALVAVPTVEEVATAVQVPTVEEVAAAVQVPTVEEVAAAVQVPTVEEVAAAVQVPTVEEVAAAVKVPTVEEVAAAVKVPTVEEVAAAVQVPTVEEVAAAVQVPTVEEVAAAVKVPTVEEVAAAVQVPTVEEVAAAVHVPTVEEVAATVHVPTVEEVAAAVKVPTVEEVAAAVKVPTVEEVAAAVHVPTVEEVAAAVHVPTVEEVAAAVHVPTVEEVAAAVKVPTVEEVAAAVKVPTVEEVAAAVHVPTVEEVAAAVQVPTVEEVAAAVHVPTVEEVAAAVHVPTVEEVAAAVKVPTVEEVAAAVQVPTVEEVAAAVKVPTVEEVAAAVKVPTVEEVAAAVQVPTVEEVAAVVHVPTVEEVAAAVQVPTVEEVAAAVQVPTVEEVAAAVQVPTVEEVAAAVHVPTVEEVAAAVKVPTVEEVAAAVQVPTVEEVAAAVHVPTVEEVAAAVHVPTVEEVAAAVQVPTVEEVAAAVHVPTVEEVAAAVQVPTVEEVVAAVQVPTVEDVAAAVRVPTVEEVAAAVHVPSADEVARLVNVPTAEEVAATVRVPTAEEVAQLVDVPTVEEVAAAVRVPTADDVASLVDVPTVEEVAALLDIDEQVTRILSKAPEPATNVQLTCHDDGTATVTWTIDILKYLTAITHLEVTLLAADAAIAVLSCDPYSVQHADIASYPYDANLRAAVAVHSRFGASEISYSPLHNVRKPIRQMFVRGVDLESTEGDAGTYDALRVILEFEGTADVSVSAGDYVVGSLECHGDGGRSEHMVAVTGTAEVLDVAVRFKGDVELLQVKVNKRFRRRIDGNLIRFATVCEFAEEAPFVFRDLELRFTDMNGRRFDSNRYRTPRDRLGNVVSVDVDSLTLTHRRGALDVSAGFPFCFLPRL